MGLRNVGIRSGNLHVFTANRANYPVCKRLGAAPVACRPWQTEVAVTDADCVVLCVAMLRYSDDYDGDEGVMTSSLEQSSCWSQGP